MSSSSAAAGADDREVTPRGASRAPSALRRLVQVEHSQKRLLRSLAATDALHPLLALFLLLEQLSLTRDVAAVALREHVLPPRLDRLARDDPRADRGLDRDVEHLLRNLLAQLLDERLAAAVREVLVHDQRERVDRLAADEHVH